MKVEEFRNSFPGLEQSVNGHKLCYLDNAATTQRCVGTLNLLRKLSQDVNANVHRSVYQLASAATAEYESTRDYVREYINAAHREEIIFTSGTTFSINLVAYSWGSVNVKSGDTIIVGESEHHSNLVPWQLLAQCSGAKIEYMPLTAEGKFDLEALKQMLNSSVKLVTFAHVSNVIGIVNPVKDIVSLAHAVGARVLVDGAQGIVHCDVDVQDMDCDFYAFSGHKVFASTGTGVLYAKREILETMPPFLAGGEMIGTVTFETSTYADLPYKFEAGTPNFNAVPTLKTGLEMLGQARGDKELVDASENVKLFVNQSLSKINRVRVLGSPKDLSDKVPLFSIVVDDVHHEDLATLLDAMGIAVRSGHVCAEPLMSCFDTKGILRASFAPYNTMEEAVYFIACLKRAIAMLS